MKTKTALFSFMASIITLGITFAQNAIDAILPVLFITFNVLIFGFGIWLFIFWIQMLIDVIKHQEKDKALWVIVIVLGNSIGAIVYYFAARRPRLAAMKATQGPVVAPTPPTQIPTSTPTPTENPFS